MKHFINKIKSSFLVKKLEKLLNRVKSSAIVKNDGKNFLHFFVAFTVIFAALTIIILQVLTNGLFRATDQNLHDLSQNPNFLNAQVMSQEGQQLPQLQQGDYGPANNILVYDSTGKLLNVVDSSLGTTTQYQIQKAVKFNKNDVGTVQNVTVHNPYGADWNYRYLTVEGNYYTQTINSMTGEPQRIMHSGYFQIFQNVDQLRTSLSSNIRLILTTMALFWLVSLIASLYLANWSLKPIMLAYERQKEFVENASHELRTPLAILQNRLELLFQKPTATIIDESKNISESLSEVRNMRLLTTNLLNLARRDSGIKIEPEETKADFFEGIFASYGMLAENAEKEFDGSVKLEGSVQLDQSLVKQLLTILFDNALKYTNDDGKIAIDVQKVGGNLNLTVSDNGDGISDEDKKRIFDRFFRVDKARTRQKGGLGLGLSLAKQIVDAYNGKISVEDNQPKGVKFIVRLRLDNPIVNPANIFKKL